MVAKQQQQQQEQQHQMWCGRKGGGMVYRTAASGSSSVTGGGMNVQKVAALQVVWQGVCAYVLRRGLVALSQAPLQLSMGQVYLFFVGLCCQYCLVVLELDLTFKKPAVCEHSIVQQQ
jgi:hypothetical protein